MSLFLRRSLSERSENLQRSPSLASIRENDSSDSWSTHENADDRNDRIQGKCESRKLDYLQVEFDLICWWCQQWKCRDKSSCWHQVPVILSLGTECFHNKNHLLASFGAHCASPLHWQKFSESFSACGRNKFLCLVNIRLFVSSSVNSPSQSTIDRRELRVGPETIDKPSHCKDKIKTQ